MYQKELPGGKATGRPDVNLSIDIEQGEVIEDLLCNNLRLIQKDGLFKFGLDSVLLANFTYATPGSRIVELCAGSCVVSILLSSKTKAAHITGVEVLNEFVCMAKKSITLNRLDGRVDVVNGDIKNISALFQRGSADTVVVNPPYIKHNSALVGCDDLKNIAKHEILCNLNDVVKAASYLLPSGGSFFMVHRPQRLTDVFCAMRECGVEPKYIKTVHSRYGQRAVLALIEGRKSSGRELIVLDPLFVYDKNGTHISQDKLNELSARPSTRPTTRPTTRPK